MRRDLLPRPLEEELMEFLAPALPPELPDLANQAKALVIGSAPAAQQAADLLRRVKAGIGAVKEIFAPMKRSADEAKKAILEAEKAALEAPLEAETWLKQGLSAWGAKLEAEKAELQRQAFARAEEERRRLQAAADAEATQRAALQRDAEAEALLDAGETEHALALMAAPAPVAVAAPVPAVRPVYAAPPPAAPAGVSYRAVWTIEVFDKPALLAWVMQAPITRAVYIDPNEKNLGALARAAKRAEAAPPGCKFVSSRVVASK